MKRRQFVAGLLKAGTTAGLAGFLPASASTILPALQRFHHSSPADAARDEAFWETVRQAYDISPAILYLNNGGSSPAVMKAFEDEDKQQALARNAPAFYLWRSMSKQRELVRNDLGAFLGVDPEQVAILRNTTEALVTVFQGLDIPDGSEIVTTNQDYPTMLHTLDMLARRRKWKVKRIDLPRPLGDPDEIARLVCESVTKKTRMVLLSDVLFQTGERMPIREISDRIQDRNPLIVVDGAHTVGQFPVNPAELGCHYFASSLHKWLSAPLGTGMLWIHPDHIESTWPVSGYVEGQDNDIRKFEHSGTRSIPAELAIRSAIEFHNTIGTDRKLARLQYLTEYWWERVRDLDQLELKTNISSPDRFGALASISCPTIGEFTLDRHLQREQNVIISRIDPDNDLYRVSPHVYTMPRDLDRLVTGIRSYVTG